MVLRSNLADPLHFPQFTHAARYQARDIAENMRKGEFRSLSHFSTAR